MARQTIGIGSAPNDGTGDSLRNGGDKINDNFIEVYARGSYHGDFDPTGDVLPTSGGNYTGGVAAQGDSWRLTADYKGWRGKIEAAIDDPQDDDDWNFINLTTF